MNGIRVFILVLVLSGCHFAQTLTDLSGNVESGNAYLGNDWVVELQNFDRSAQRLQSFVSSDGSFKFYGVSAGQYTLRLVTLHGNAVSEKLIDVSPSTASLTIQLPTLVSARPVAGTVTVRELGRVVPEKALRLFAEAQRESQQRNHAEAARKLERAIQLHPGYSEARCNLGVQYIRLGRLEDALGQFEIAIATGPPSAITYGNLSYVHYSAGRLVEAAQAARHAVALDPSSISAHYLLGSILARSVRPAMLAHAREAIVHLRLGMPLTPRARVELARVHLAEGDQARAAAELRDYLRSGDTAYRVEAEQLLAKLAAD